MLEKISSLPGNKRQVSFSGLGAETGHWLPKQAIILRLVTQKLLSESQLTKQEKVLFLGSFF